MKKEKKHDVREDAAKDEEVKQAEGGAEVCESEDMPSEEIYREEMSDGDYIAALEVKLGKALAEIESVKALAQRVQADFDNYRKRNNSMAEDMKALGQSTVIEKMLTVLDNCDLARKYISDEAALTGFNMMEAQILGALTGFGLAEIEADGKEFDAKTMSAVERVKDAENAGKVVEVLLKGYTLNGKLLRPASVKIAYAD